MDDFDKMLIKAFLEENYSSFQQFLEEKNIEGTEAELIIEKLESE